MAESDTQNNIIIRTLSLSISELSFLIASFSDRRPHVTVNNSRLKC